MAGTREGALKAVRTNRRKRGPNYYKKIGSRGGEVEVPKGFSKNKYLASCAGKMGGKASRRRD